jgi:hypothetical protein
MADTLTITEAEAVELTLAYISELNALAEVVGVALRDIFANLAHTDRADIEAFIAEASPYTNAGVAEAGDLAAAYISEMTGTAVKPSDLLAPEIAFDGPFLRTWHNLSEGMPYDQAKESGASVAEMTGYSATNDGAVARLSQSATKTYGWRRVINPTACEWCRVVATQLYKTQASATFGHLNCHCTTVPAMHELDPGKAINQARLRELKASGAVERVSKARERSRQRERDALRQALQ